MSSRPYHSPEKKAPLPIVPVTAFLIALCGLLTIVSAQSDSGEPFRLAARQLCFLLVSLPVMMAAARVPFQLHCRLTPFYAALSLLSLLLLPLFGTQVNGMRGWYVIGHFFVQPSELAKGVFLLMLTLAATGRSGDRKKFLLMAAATLLWTLPILLQPDFGTAAVYLAGFAAIYFLTGGSPRGIAATLLSMAATAIVFVLCKPYAWQRLTAFLDPEHDPTGAGWHIRQFQLAIAHGGMFGSKIGHAVWSNAYLPLAYNDSAYATMAETLGLAGSATVVMLFAVMIGALFKTPKPPKPPAARLYPTAAAILLAIQALLHISVNVGLLPPTGLTLPLVSYGGSSMIGTFFMLGVALSAKRDR